MKNKFQWIVLSLVLFSASLSWGQVCASNVAEFNALKSKIPASFQNLPAVFTIDKPSSGILSPAVRAGFVLKAVGDNLVLQMKVVRPIQTSNQQKVAQACLSGNNIVVKLENGKEYKVAVLSGGRIDIDGRQLSKTTISSFTQLMNKSDASPGSGGSSASGGT